jgi:AhpD family alkylhydroperoxidase
LRGAGLAAQHALSAMRSPSACGWIAGPSPGNPGKVCIEDSGSAVDGIAGFPFAEAPTRRTTMFDMKNLRHLKKLDENAPDAMKAFWAFDKAAFAEGALSVREKQLIAVAVALTTQCPYCIELHNKAAREAGASDAQLSEAAMVAAAIRAGGAVTHATHLFAG